jgi:hypothetical protein
VASKRVRVVLLAIVTTALVLGTAGDGASARRPGIAFAADMPGDLEALASATWRRFTDAFPARWGCVPAVRVGGAWSLAARARYEPAGRLVTIRIPGTAPTLRSTLVHEFAHHVEFTCPQQRSLRPRFAAAQGVLPATPWFGGAVWERIPSEQFAEATVLLVLGPSGRPRVPIASAALAVLRAWALGH